ncbi:prepilin-type N-terminal cleavage/methylation domain-containing protein [Microcoleus sp. MON1_C1]|uniref:prepilin-type N-terminal cleavage/methylation domain-containing protein n=1 Tax=Microcoleus sp. MON1_C1 TaxID=2818827 RepID=UPI002FD4A3D6
MKTPPILLKLLHNSAAKPSPNFNKTASRKSDGGFTLLEVLVIALIIGIFSSIAAPSWEAFINRQRVRTVNDRVFQSLRLAQSEAKRTKSSVTVTFHYDPNPAANPVADPPTVTFSPPLPTGGSTQTLNAGGEIKPGTIALTFNKPDSTDPKKSSLVFDYQGNPSTTQFVVTVAPSRGGAKQCARVETLIGGMRTAEGTECN